MISFRRIAILFVCLSLRGVQVYAEADPALVSESSMTFDMDPIVVLGSRIERNPAGRTIGRLERQNIEGTDPFTLRDLMIALPGITVKQSNGPRDVGISMRGSGAKQSFGVRNIKMYEDWFPVTQSDGLSRTDLHDPTAYEGVDVIRGPSSSLHDNYAVGGVVNFRSRQGRDIDGIEIGGTGGSFGYSNTFAQMGKRYERFEYSAFASYITGDGYIRHSQFRSVTQNINLIFRPDEQRTVTLKYLNNDLRANVPSRLTLNQYDLDPSTEGITNVTGVGNVTASRADQNRQDRRTIVGARYEHAFTPQTGLRVLGEYDVKDINQTFGTISDNINPNFHHYADLTHEGPLLGMNAKHLVGFFFNFMEQEANSLRNLADYNGTRGALQSNSRGFHRNIGGRLREELDFNDRWSAFAGAGVESSKVRADIQTRTAAETYSRVSVDRTFFNAAPETGVIFRVLPETKLHARFGTGYGIPGISQLTTLPNGLSGNNSSLKPQVNYGFELGADGKVANQLSFDVAGYYEIFYDEFVTQSPGAGLSSFTDNAPRADHRGVEVWSEWRPSCGFFWSGAYTFNDHEYVDYNETIGAGVTLDRKGKKVPGVERHLANTRIGFDRKNLPGGWIEVYHTAPFYINNSNTLEMPESTLLNLNVHYTREISSGFFRKVTLFVDVRNVTDQKYINSANVVSDLTTDTPATLRSTKQAFFSGQPLSVFGGVKLAF